MRPESPLLLEADGRELFGVVTRPDDHPVGGVLLLAGVGIAAPGNARLFVHAARALADAGCLVLRLDCHGFGDSGADSRHPLPGEPRTADGRAGLAWLGERAEWTAIVGECHGARTALAAAADGGVREVVALFPPLWDLGEAEQAPDGDPGFLDGVRAATAEGAHVHVVYGEGDLDLPYFRRAVDGPLADLVTGGALTYEVAEERLHGLASAAAVDHVLAAIDDRLVRAVNFDWTPEQEEFRASVLGFAERLDAREPVDGFDRAAWEACGTFGIQGLLVPEEHGGSAADALTAVAAMEALGYAYRNTGLLFSLNAQMWAVQHPLVRFGNDEQKARYLPGLCRGELIGAHAATEPDAGSDVFGLRTSAVPDGDDWILTGAKTFTSNGPVADVFLVLATTDPQRGAFGLCAFLVDRATPGLEASAPMAKMGLAGSPIGDVHLDQCRVPGSAMLGRPGIGMALFSSAMDWERTLILASVLGVMSRHLDRSVAFAKERRQFGQPIGDFQAVAHRIVQMRLRLDAGRLLLQRAAWLLDNDRPATAEAALAKLWVSESYLASSLDAVHLHGGAGFLEATGLSSSVADAIAARLYSGTSEMQMNLVARQLGL